jgi:hypothetical protein
MKHAITIAALALAAAFGGQAVHAPVKGGAWCR